MSNIKIVDAIIDAQTGKPGLVIEQAGEKYVLTSKGLSTFAEHAGELREAVSGAKAETLIEGALHQVVADPSKLPESVRKNLHKVEGVFPVTEHTKPLLAKLGESTGVLKAIEAGDKAGLEAIFTAKPELLKAVPAEQLEAVTKLGIDTDAITKTAEAAAKVAEEIATKAANLTKAQEGLQALLDAKKPDGQAINKFLRENIEHIDELKHLPSPKNFNLTGAVGHVQSEMLTAGTKAKTLVADIVRDSRAASAAEALGDVDKAKELREAITKSTEEVNTLANGHFGASIKKNMDPEMLTRLGGHNPNLAQSLGAEGVEAASKGKFASIVSKIFVRGDAAQKGVTGFKAISKTKTGLVVGGVVLAGYVAGIGRKGKHADQVAQQQDQGMAMGA